MHGDLFQFLDVFAAVSLTDMVSQRFFTDAEHQSEAELEFVRSQEVTLATDDKTTCADEHTRGRRLRYLVSIDPVDLGCDLVLPARAVAHLESGSFVET